MMKNETTFYLATDGRWVDGPHEERNEYDQPTLLKGSSYWRCKADGSIWKARPTTVKFFGFDDAGGGFGSPFKPENYTGQPYAAQRSYDGGWRGKLAFLWDAARWSHRFYKVIDLLEKVLEWGNGLWRTCRFRKDVRALSKVA